MDMGLACCLPGPWPLLLSTLTRAALLSQSLALFPSLTLGTKHSLLSHLVSTLPGLLWPWAQTPDADHPSSAPNLTQLQTLETQDGSRRWNWREVPGAQGSAF